MEESKEMSKKMKGRKEMSKKIEGKITRGRGNVEQEVSREICEKDMEKR